MNQPNIIFIQYPCLSSTARNLEINCLIAFHNGFKSVAQSFNTAFIFVFNSSSELNDSPTLSFIYFRFYKIPKENSNESHQVKRAAILLI